MDALVATMSAVGMFYSEGIMADPAARWGAAVRILTKVPTMVAALFGSSMVMVSGPTTCCLNSSSAPKR